jgi:dCTP diphosphatase
MTRGPNPQSIQNLNSLRTFINEFRVSRGWKVPHSPQATAISISLEASELLEHFQWATSQEQAEKILADNKAEISYEVADVFMYILEFCDDHGIDLIKACRDKMTINDQRFAIKE